MKILKIIIIGVVVSFLIGCGPSQDEISFKNCTDKREILIKSCMQETSKEYYCYSILKNYCLYEYLKINKDNQQEDANMQFMNGIMIGHVMGSSMATRRK